VTTLVSRCPNRFGLLDDHRPVSELLLGVGAAFVLINNAVVEQSELFRDPQEEETVGGRRLLSKSAKAVR